MTVLFNLISLFGVVVVAVIGRVLGEDAKVFIPSFSEELLRKSAGRLHEDIAERYLEEWLSHNDSTKTLTGKLTHAASI
ncbi:hypothetical protein [Paracoccus marinaquae]|uniref:Uncharacterized protein n=1 Tax=Paracoccus marinaquae TaxID=2841926 RepID=A0ABS6AKA8_9RHOB|nr:hypothetical protein [Paracoccus marinaquae]MBU3030085.1 hypothetical protein [Paracoccus marinaquae]